MRQLHVTLFGGFQARHGSGRALRLRTRQTQALLAYLALPAGRVHTRDKLAALLWGHVAQDEARHRLRQTLFALRRALGPDVPCFRVDSDTVALDAAAIEVDTARFEELVRDGSSHALEQAATLYRGDLLEGLPAQGPHASAFEEWLAFERRRLKDLAIAVLGQLLLLQLQDHRAEAAAATARRLLELDEADEGAHRALMRLYARRGERNAALRQYQLCRTVLARELGVEPEEETERLRSELCHPPADAPAASPLPPMPGADPARAPGLMPDGVFWSTHTSLAEASNQRTYQRTRRGLPSASSR